MNETFDLHRSHFSYHNFVAFRTYAICFKSIISQKLVSLQYIYFFNSFVFLEFNTGQRFEYQYPLTVIEKQLSTWRIILSLNVGFMVQLTWSRVYCLWISTKMKDKPIVQLDNYFCRDNNFNTHNNDQKQYFNHLI